MRTRITLTLALAFAMPAAACGGDDKPSKDEWIKKADALCAKYDPQIEEAGRKAVGDTGGKVPRPEQITKFINAALPVQEKEISEIDKLERPDGDDDKIQKIVDAAEGGNRQLEKAASDPDLAQRLIVEQKEDPFAEANRLAREYGLKKCGQEG